MDGIQDRDLTVPMSANSSQDAVPYLRLDGLSKHFGEFLAVDSVSLEIARGEIFCLLGGSGSGKTTLLRMLGGFERPSAGRIWLDGQDMSAVAPHDRPINMMFQSYALFPHMSVEKNVAFGLEQERLPRQEIRARVTEMLEIVQMGRYAGRRPHQLSGGQRQRVALARALVKRPKLLLLDEPLAALDRKLRERTQFELLNIQQRLGVTFIVVTHDQDEAMTLATRIGVMDRGRIVQVGAPAQIYESPASRFVADFIGSVNLIECRVAEAGSGTVLVRSEAPACAIRAACNLHCAVNDTVWVALRPERIQLQRQAAQDPVTVENRLSGRVRDIAYMGDVSICLVETGSGVLRVTVPNSSGMLAHVAQHDLVQLGWDASAPVVLSQ